MKVEHQSTLPKRVAKHPALESVMVNGLQSALISEILTVIAHSRGI